MSSALDAAAPRCNAAVLASAGTGKTWLLVTRMVRLLLDGVDPDGILAVTFTRKAAAEMQARLAERLRSFVELDKDALDQALGHIGLTPDASLRRRARALYEDYLFSERPVRTTTFHAFCQELLRRFPLEADVPPGFELLDTAGLLEDEAWDALFNQATREPDGALATALETLFTRCHGLHNTRTALLAFLRHREDWWAFTEDQSSPLSHAAQTLARLLDVDPDDQPLTLFFTEATVADLGRFAGLLSRHETKQNHAHAVLIDQALGGDETLVERFHILKCAFFTDKGLPRTRKSSQTQRRSLGEGGEAEFLELHQTLCARIAEAAERLARYATYTLSRAWFEAGSALLDHFQRIKRERRLLDFTDLEWNAYRLLNDSGNAHWVQYKLDQRIDHLLIDEFQDTNPTQWRLVLPLLQELAAGGERVRSVFIVGDMKQSIYGFRRADARLLDGAATWLREHLQAQTYALDKSRRSAPAIMTLVNCVFTDGPLGDALGAFHPHDTHHSELWGRVELLPLVAAAESSIVERDGLRNPLLEPRAATEDDQHYEEGRLVAQRIGALIAGGAPVGRAAEQRPIGCSDITILLRKRTHAHAYERALRDAGIPYSGAGRGSLLDTLEVQDMVSLLKVLIAPYDNLALAQVLRSPLFAAEDRHLMQLAAAEGPWIERLATVSADLQTDDSPLARAQRWLSRWRLLAERLPVHDLLDQIYCQGNVLARFEAAFPAPLRPRVRANLTRFIELALEVDSGRYPSLSHFLARLRDLQAHEEDAPEEAPASDAGAPRVRIMTIHSAKGLESSVVFLADTGGAPAAARPYEALVDWPTRAARPTHLLLTGRKAELDSVSEGLLAARAQTERREEANLLYVALTRARQLLFISGCAPGRGTAPGWYGVIEQQMGGVARALDDGTLLIESGAPRPATQQTPRPQPPAPTVDPRLSQPIGPTAPIPAIRPSGAAQAGAESRAEDPDACLRGRLIHRLLELHNRNANRVDDPALLGQAATEFSIEADNPLLAEAWQEARKIFTHPRLQSLFDAQRFVAAYDEVPIHYRGLGGTVYGVVDRLLLSTAGEALIIDYKTHQNARPDNLALLAAPYIEQMALYRNGVERLWPDKRVRCVLLFTACAALYELPVDSAPETPIY